MDATKFGWLSLLPVYAFFVAHHWHHHPLSFCTFGPSMNIELGTPTTHPHPTPEGRASIFAQRTPARFLSVCPFRISCLLSINIYIYSSSNLTLSLLSGYSPIFPCVPQHTLHLVCLYPSVCLSVSLSLRLFVSLSVCISLSLCLSVSLCLSLSVSLCLFVCLSVCLCLCLPVCLSVCLSVCLKNRIYEDHLLLAQIQQLIWGCTHPLD